MTKFRKADERTDHDLCPRCGVRFLPATYPGALSRADNATEICSDCGTIEAMEQYATGGLTVPPAGWPTRDRDLETRPGIRDLLRQMSEHATQ